MRPGLLSRERRSRRCAMGRTEKETGPGTTVCGYRRYQNRARTQQSTARAGEDSGRGSLHTCLSCGPTHALVLFSARMSGDGGGSASYIPSELQEAVLLKSVPMPADSLEVKGHDFSEARALFRNRMFVLLCTIVLSGQSEFPTKPNII